MPQHPQRSLRHEYDVYVEQEIERYKDSIPRSAILKIGDEAVSSLQSQEQFGFDELLIWAEVDRLIRRRLRVPTYDTWRRRRIKLIEEYRRPEHWGLSANAPIVREIVPSTETHVLLAGVQAEGTALYLVTNGCQITALHEEEEMVERVLSAAGQVGLTSRVHGTVSAIDRWAPEQPLTAVICSTAAFAKLSPAECARVIEVLQGATLDGGVHLVQTIVAGQNALSLDQLRERYHGWDITVSPDEASSGTFMARKHLT